MTLSLALLRFLEREFHVQYVDSAPPNMTGSDHRQGVWIANERDRYALLTLQNIYKIIQEIPKNNNCALYRSPILARAKCRCRFHRATVGFAVANHGIIGNFPYRAFTTDVVTPPRPPDGHHFVFLSNQVLQVKSLY